MAHHKLVALNVAHRWSLGCLIDSICELGWANLSESDMDRQVCRGIDSQVAVQVYRMQADVVDGMANGKKGK